MRTLLGNVPRGRYNGITTTLQEVEQAALAFPPHDRAVLAANLLHSLPASFEEEEDELAVAMQRDAELDADPSLGMSLDDFKRVVARCASA